MHRVLDVPGSTDRILLLDCAPNGRHRNLLRCRADGSVAWHAHLPVDIHQPRASEETADCYVDASIDQWLGMAWVSATSWSCYSVTIGLRTGRLRTSRFTK